MTSLIVEDGSVIAGANTYQSLASISTYCSDMGYTAWASLSTANQTSAVFRGMAYIESKSYKGMRTSSGSGFGSSENQVLEWPRAYVYDRNNALIYNNVIPRNLKKALSEAAYREGQSVRSLQPDLVRGGRVKRKKIDVLETEWTSGAPVQNTLTIINGYLQGYIFAGGSLPIMLTG